MGSQRRECRPLLGAELRVAVLPNGGEVDRIRVSAIVVAGHRALKQAQPTSLAAGRDTGAQVDVRGGKRWHAEAGVFLGDGRGRQHRGGATVASRLEWRPFGPIEVAAYGSVGRVSAVSDDSDPNGFTGRATSSYRFFDRVYVQGRRRPNRRRRAMAPA